VARGGGVTGGGEKEGGSEAGGGEKISWYQNYFLPTPPPPTKTIKCKSIYTG